MMMVGENQHHGQSSRLGLLRRCSRGGGGEIVEVQGGHIVRSTGRKDRHSKVCTAKGPRDRRVRLSAHTAIQFYDVQDRLGCDRPSKAVDWLIDKAKTAIGQLAELPPWHPIETQSLEHDQEESEAFDDSSNKRPMEDEPEANNGTSFLPPSLDSDAIAKTIKSFFPMAANATSSSSINFQNFPSDQTQDLCLSLQSFQEPILLHQHSSTSTTTSAQQTLFSSSIPMACDATWNAGIDTSGGGGFVFNSPPQPPMFLGQNPLFSQRGPLQSSNSPLFRAWMDPIASTTTNHPHHHHHHQMPMLYQSSISGIGFHIPARIQGEDEQDAASSNPSSASRH